MNATIKTIAAALLFTAWGVMAYTGMAPVDQFIAAIRDALIALGVFQATITKG